MGKSTISMAMFNTCHGMDSAPPGFSQGVQGARPGQQSPELSFRSSAVGGYDFSD